MDLTLIMLTSLSAFFGSIGQIEFKRGANNLQLDILSLLTNFHLIVGVLMYMISTLIYIYVLSRGQLSMIYPIIATSYIWTLLFAMTFLNEPVNLMNWLGAFLILIGITFTVIK